MSSSSVEKVSQPGGALFHCSLVLSFDGAEEVR